MNRRYKEKYWVSQPSHSHLWWVPRLKKWVTAEDMPLGFGGASFREVRSKKKALDMLSYMGDGAQVLAMKARLYWINGG